MEHISAIATPAPLDANLADAKASLVGAKRLGEYLEREWGRAE